MMVLAIIGTPIIIAIPQDSMSFKQSALDKRLNRAFRDVETKAEYKPLNYSSVEEYYLWSRQFNYQLEEHGLDNFLHPNFRDIISDLMSMTADDIFFTTQPALLKIISISVR